MAFFSSHPALLAVQNRVAAVIKPGPAYIAWAQKVAKKDGGMVPTKEECAAQEGLTILLPHYDDPAEAGEWLKAMYLAPVMMEMLNHWTQDSNQWPDPNIIVWEDWFRVEIHSMIFDGGGGTLKVDKKDDLVTRWHAWAEKH